MKQDNWEWVDINLIKTDGENPNVMNKTQKEALKANMIKYGWNMPILTDMAYLLADGEQKLIIAKEMGWNTVPILRKNSAASRSLSCVPFILFIDCLIILLSASVKFFLSMGTVFHPISLAIISFCSPSASK